MNVIERYLGRVLISHSLLVLFVLLLILGFTEFMLQLAKIDEGYTLAKAVLYTLLKLPVYAYDIFPVALLIGALMGLGGLANHAELTVLRVTGWSIRRIFLGVMKSALLLWAVFAVLGEWAAPQAESYAQKIRTEALNKNFSIGNRDDFWMKDENRYIHVHRIISDTHFQGVEIYQQDAAGIRQKITAKSADFIDSHWRLNQVTQSDLAWQSSDFVMPRVAQLKQLRWQQTQHPSLEVTLPVDPKMLQGLQVDTRYMNLLDLVSYIGFLNENGLDAEPYKLALWRKLMSPLAVFGMIALVFPLIFGAQRQVSIGQRIFVGIVIGLGFHLLNQIIGNLTVVYQLPTWLGASMPSVVLILIALTLMKRLR